MISPNCKINGTDEGINEGDIVVKYNGTVDGDIVGIMDGDIEDVDGLDEDDNDGNIDGDED